MPRPCSGSRPAARSGSSSTNLFWSRISPRSTSLPSSARTPSLPERRPAKLLLQTAYGHVGEAYPTLAALPVDGIGLDRAGPENLDLMARDGFLADKWLAVGVVDGRNVWTNDLAASLDLLGRIQEHVPSDRLMISASCSLQHVPYDVGLEDELPVEVRPWLAFAEQKLAEIVTLTRAVNEERMPSPPSSPPAAPWSSPRRRHRCAATRKCGGGWRSCHRTPIAARSLCRAREAATAATEPAAVADHHHRLIPADGRDPFRPQGRRRRHDLGREVRGVSGR